MKRRTFKHYLLVYGVSFLFMFVLAIVSYTRVNSETGEYGYLVSSSINVSGAMANEFSMFGRPFIVGLFIIDMAAIFGFPLVLSLLFFIIDLARGRTGKVSEEQVQKEAYEKFIDGIGSTLNKTHKFNVEDFRHFRENDKFQGCLKNLYEIYSNGETEENKYVLIIRKFQKGTKERDAMEFLVTFTEEKRQELVAKEKAKAVEEENKDILEDESKEEEKK
ncbi:MAG: hypothetical protein K6G38_01355 [Gammaproteobacteria bacterium]|nr:hypothetical protein [Gammaproteobacteria bacterium]